MVVLLSGCWVGGCLGLCKHQARHTLSQRLYISLTSLRFYDTSSHDTKNLDVQAGVWGVKHLEQSLLSIRFAHVASTPRCMVCAF